MLQCGMDKIRSLETKNYLPQLLLALTALIIIRLLPIFKAPLSNYGYDFGFYAYAASHAWQYSLKNLFTSALWGGYNSPLFLLGHWLGIPSTILVNELYFLASLALGLAIYFWMKLKSPLAGILAALLVGASTVQTAGYLMFLWKNILALPLLILGFKFLEQKKYWHLAACALGMLLLHRTTAIIFFLTLMVYGVFELIKQKKFRLLAGLIIGAVILAGLAFYGFGIKSIINNLLDNHNSYVTSGLFLEGQNLWQVGWPFILMAVPGAYLYLKNRRHPILPLFTAVLLIWIIFQFPFYRRMLLYLDVCLLAFGAYFLSQVNYSRRLMRLAVGVVIAVLFIRSANYALSQSPIISAQEVSEIKNFNQPPGFVLAVSADDAPWLLAYAQNQRLGAPGLLEDPQSYRDWLQFWAGQNQRQFLSKYPRPLYFYQRSWRLPPTILTKCLIPISANFSAVDYACLETPPPAD